MVTRESKLELINIFETGYSAIDEMIENVGREEMLFVPPISEAWSLNDFLVHFLDADQSLAFRVRTAIAEPGKAVPVWEEEAWHDKLHYEAQDGRACLSLAKGIRGFLATCLRSVVDEDWDKFFIVHPVKGKLKLADLLEMYHQHIVFHQPLIRRNMRAWSERSS
jgi:hypothetical protein